MLRLRDECCEKKVEPENSEGHLSNDNQAATLHLTERVKQAAVVVVQAGC